jgi:hypothetical protein
MKIGIITIYWDAINNYGCALQCYALQTYFRNAGHDVYLIRYLPKVKKSPIWQKIIKAFNPVLLGRFLMGRFNLFLGAKNDINSRDFISFRNTYLKQSEIIYSYKELAENPPDADVYIVGSDQVWNFLGAPLKKVKGDRLRAYFLDFGSDKIKRVAYAASFGEEKLAPEFIRAIAPLLKRFSYVSVREKSALEICRQCSVFDGEWVPDPTLLHDAEHYRSLISEDVEKILNPNRPYCLIYIIGNHSNLSTGKVFEWVKNKKLHIVYVPIHYYLYPYKKTFPTVPQWLYLVDNAEYVVTNSYHAALFSLIFQTQFGIISNNGIDAGANTRFTSLFEWVGLEDRCIDNDLTVLDKAIDWNAVSYILGQGIKEGIKLESKRWR